MAFRCFGKSNVSEESSSQQPPERYPRSTRLSSHAEVLFYKYFGAHLTEFAKPFSTDSGAKKTNYTLPGGVMKSFSSNIVPSALSANIAGDLLHNNEPLNKIDYVFKLVSGDGPDTELDCTLSIIDRPGTSNDTPDKHLLMEFSNTCDDCCSKKNSSHSIPCGHPGRISKTPRFGRGNGRKVFENLEIDGGRELSCTEYRY